MDPSLTFLQSCVSKECTLQVTADLLRWSPNHGKRRAGNPAITYIDQLCRDTECLPNDFLALLQDRDGWLDRLMNA